MAARLTVHSVSIISSDFYKDKPNEKYAESMGPHRAFENEVNEYLRDLYDDQEVITDVDVFTMNDHLIAVVKEYRPFKG